MEGDDNNAWRGIMRCNYKTQKEMQWECMKWNEESITWDLKKKVMIKDEMELRWQ